MTFSHEHRLKLKENPSFLYGVILQYETLSRYLLCHSVDSFLHDRITDSSSPTSSTPTESVPIQYSHYLLAMGKRYLDRLEVVRKGKNVSYFTAKEVR